MRLRTPVSGARHEDILELEPLLRRVVGARVRDPDTVDGLVQEALARVIAVRGRLEDEAISPYAIVTARILVTSLAREEERSRRHRPRLVDPSEPERPEDAALRQEEAAAVETALPRCPTMSGRRWWPMRSRGSTPPPWPRPGSRPRAQSGSSWPGHGPGSASTTCWPCAAR